VTAAAAAATLSAMAACLMDLRERRIPNSITFGSAVAAMAYHAFTTGLTGLAFAVSGWGVGVLLFLPLFALRGIGGGDVKLLAAFGAWLGPGAVIWVALFGVLAGGVFALMISAWRGYTQQAFRNVWSMLNYWRVMGIRPHPAITLDRSIGPRVPYALPLAAGLGMTLWLR
jgi:prepilin peptidase CpaA